MIVNEEDVITGRKQKSRKKNIKLRSTIEDRMPTFVQYTLLYRQLSVMSDRMSLQNLFDENTKEFLSSSFHALLTLTLFFDWRVFFVFFDPDNNFERNFFFHDQ
jgi:translation elongation factor EF-Ts